MSPATSNVKKNILAIDRFGDRETPLPKTVFGCVVTLMFYIVLLSYGVAQYVSYLRRPVVQTSDVGWTIVGGPFALPLTCFSEHCWVSTSYSVEALSRDSDCIAAIPEEQRDQCRQMAPGEEVVLQICDSHLPGQGVHLHFGGAPHWGETGTRLGISSHANMFGFAITSQMRGMSGSVRVVNVLTPLRSGVTLLHHVFTENCTVDGVGRERREWFIVPTGMQETDLLSSGTCGTQLASGANLSHSVLKMAPDYTHIQVHPPESFVLDLISDIGGAIELFDIVLASTLLAPALWLAAKHCHSGQDGGCLPGFVPQDTGDLEGGRRRGAQKGPECGAHAQMVTV